MVKEKIKEIAESIKQSGKKIKEYLIDDTVNDINKTMKNLEPNKKKIGDLDEKKQ